VVGTRSDALLRRSVARHHGRNLLSFDRRLMALHPDVAVGLRPLDTTDDFGPLSTVECDRTIELGIV
jgi:hypothetical protein